VLTVYDATRRMMVEIGKGDGWRIFQALKRADSIHSKLDKTKNKLKDRSEFPDGEDGTAAWRDHNRRARNNGKCHRRQLRRAYLGTLERVRDRVDDLHTKAAVWLCDDSDGPCVILIPTFEVCVCVCYVCVCVCVCVCVRCVYRVLCVCVVCVVCVYVCCVCVCVLPPPGLITHASMFCFSPNLSLFLFLVCYSLSTVVADGQAVVPEVEDKHGPLDADVVTLQTAAGAT
jgi:hypothetical protein